MSLLEVENIHSGYSDVEILHGVSLNIKKGGIYCIIGPNGSGKSTLLKTIFGFLIPKKGEILFKEEKITTAKPQETLKKGICYVFQRRSIFPDLSVRKNLLMGAYVREDKEDIKKDMERIFQLFPVLAKKKKEKASTLSGGQARMLEVSRSLMVHPKLILLDEPSAGLAPQICKNTLNIINKLNSEEGITFLVVEQKVRTILELADYGYLLELGKIKAAGSSESLMHNEKELAKMYF